MLVPRVSDAVLEARIAKQTTAGSDFCGVRVVFVGQVDIAVQIGVAEHVVD
jgi:hypothetical protein